MSKTALAVTAARNAGRLLPVLPEWTMPEYSLHLVYPLPRGILPSVRSFIDFLSAHLLQNTRYKI